MGEQELSLKIKVQDDGSIVLTNFGAALQKLGAEADTAGAKNKTAWDGAKGALGGLIGQFTAANLAARAVNWGVDAVASAVGQLFVMGDALDEVEGSFQKLATAGGLNAAEMLAQMQQASDGLIPKIDLMRNANELLASGLPITEQNMAQLTQAAKLLGEAHGVDAAQAMQTFSDALVRGSDKSLQLLGVDIDLKAVTESLGTGASEAAKKHAALEAVLVKVAEQTGKLADGNQSAYDSFQKAKVAIGDWWGEVGQAVNHSEALATVIDVLITSAGGVWVAFKKAAEGVGWLITKVIELNHLREGWDWISKTFFGGGGQSVSKSQVSKATEEIRALGDVLKGTGISIKEITKGYESHGAALMALARGGGAYPQLQQAAQAALEKLRDSRQELAESSQAASQAATPMNKLAAEVAGLKKEYASLSPAQKAYISDQLAGGASTGDIAKAMGLASETVDRYKKALEEAGNKAQEAAKKFDEYLLKSLDQGHEALADLGDDFKRLPLVAVPALGETEQAALDNAKAANDLEQAYKDLGVKSAAEIKASAEKMVADYRLIESSGTATSGELQKAWQQVYDFYTQNNLTLPTEWQAAMDQMNAASQETATQVVDVWGTIYDAIARIASILGGSAGNIANAIIGTIESAKKAISGFIFGIGEDMYNGLAGIIQGISGLFDKFTQKAIAIGSQIGSTIGSFFGPIGEAIGNFLGSIGGALVGLFHKIFGQRSPEQAAIEETMKHFGFSIGQSTAAEITKAISAAFGGITGEALEDKIPIGIYLPEVQLILIRDQLNNLGTETADYWAQQWIEHTMPTLVNVFGMTQAEAAAKMQSLIQTALNALKASGQAIGPTLAGLVTWAAKLGVEFDVVGLKVRDLNGQLIDAEVWLTRTAGVEIFVGKWKAGLQQVATALNDILDAKHLESRAKQVGSMLDNFFREQLTRLREMIAQGLSADQIAQIAAQLQPALAQIAQYQLTMLDALRASGMLTTELWNTVGESMKRQLGLMRQLGLEGTAAFEKLRQEYTKLRNDAQTIAGVTGPLVDFFKKLSESGELTSKNFEQWASTALTYLHRLQAAGATASEIWTALSGIFEVFKQKHDEVFNSIQEKMNTLFTNNANLTEAMKQAIEDYVLHAKGSLEQLAAMGVPQSLLDQIQAWRTMAEQVGGPVYQALERFYAKQKELQKWTGLMDQVNALFGAMGKNLIKNEKDLKTWSDAIHKYINKMLQGGMSLQQIVGQYGGSLHQLYLEYQAQGKDVPKWLKDIEKEYQKQEAQKKAADEAQRKAQIALLEGIKALIKALGGDVPDAINQAINALNHLGDNAQTNTNKIPKKVGIDIQLNNAQEQVDKVNTALNAGLPKKISPSVDFAVTKAKTLGEFAVSQDRVDLTWKPAQTGIWDVPYDNYRALLHEEEAVLPREVAVPFREFVRSQGQGGQESPAPPAPKGGDGAAMPGGQIVINVTIQALDTQSMEDAVRRDLIPILNRAIRDNTGGLKSEIQNT